MGLTTTLSVMRGLNQTPTYISDPPTHVHVSDAPTYINTTYFYILVYVHVGGVSCYSGIVIADQRNIWKTV